MVLKGTFDWLLLLFAPKSMEVLPAGTGREVSKAVMNVRNL